MFQIPFERYKNYVNASSQGLLLTTQKFNISKYTKISVIIPVYNKEIIIKRTLRSIQNQNMKDIEIVLVNDFSTDNTLKTIKQFKNEDSRIKIINNKKNKGTLYSRCIGTLHSIGYYILPLDNDDMYLDEDIFNILYNEGLTNNLDIIKFNGLQVRGLNNFFEKKIKNINFLNSINNKIIIQPELSYFSLKRIDNKGNFISTDLYLWLKCIKSEVYKKAILLLGKERYSIFMTSGEDNIMSFMIFQTANSFKYIQKYCILRISIANSANKIRTNQEKLISKLYYLNTIYDFSKNTFKGKEIVFSITITLMNKKIFKKIIQKEKYKLFFNNILIKIFNSKFIRKKDKLFIKKKYKELNINNF
jgi:glycosyltransferase involved in cell wall biosynthesis